MSGYLFYDIETTGLNKAFDQILQFAAIRTDRSLQEKDRFALHVKLRPDIIPSPRAMITHHISLTEALDGICEFEAVREIHQLVNHPGTVSVGYNSLKFDDEFLRFSFYRNLMPPYTHQYARGCGRMDLLPMTIVYYLYAEHVMEWPLIEGKPSLRLENINRFNQFADGRAHDAMVDVEISLEMARRFYRERPIWDYLLGYFDKQTDRRRIEEIPVRFESAAGPHRVGLLLGTEFGADRRYQIPVLSIGESIPYSNQTLWLRLDQLELQKITPETMDLNSWVVRKRYGEPPIILKPLERYWEKIDDERRSTVSENLHWLQKNPDYFLQLIDYHRTFKYPPIPDLDVDAALYGSGFRSSDEQALCNRFNAASPSGKPDLIASFPDAATRELAVRLIGRNYPEHLTAELLTAWKSYTCRIQNETLSDYKGERRMLPVDALEKIRALQDENILNSEDTHLLQELENYILKHFPQKTP